jgi:hypothetical protein
VKFIHVIYGSFSVFRLQPLYAFLSIYAYSWKKIAASRTLFDPILVAGGTRRQV